MNKHALCNESGPAASRAALVRVALCCAVLGVALTASPAHAFRKIGKPPPGASAKPTPVTHASFSRQQPGTSAQQAPAATAPASSHTPFSPHNTKGVHPGASQTSTSSGPGAAPARVAAPAPAEVPLGQGYAGPGSTSLSASNSASSDSRPPLDNPGHKYPQRAAPPPGGQAQPHTGEHPNFGHPAPGNTSTVPGSAPSPEPDLPATVATRDGRTCDLMSGQCSAAPRAATQCVRGACVGAASTLAWSGRAVPHREASAESAQPLAEIVPTASEWADARRPAATSRVAPLSLTQTLADGNSVARVAGCVPVGLAPERRRAGFVRIDSSGDGLVHSVAAARDVGGVLARTRFAGVDLAAPQAMCLPQDLARQLAQLNNRAPQGAAGRLVRTREGWALTTVAARY